jgi:hypothetical protein
MKEIWKPVKHHEGLYEISNHGNVKSLNYNGSKICKLMIASPTKVGYLRLKLTINKVSKDYYIHRLVADHFICNTNILNIEINHIDGNKKNNLYYNLEWCTHQYNQQHAYIQNLLKVPSFKGGTHDKETRMRCGMQHNKPISIHGIDYKSIAEASKELNIHRTTIGSRLRSISWSTYEYIISC